LGCLRVQLDDFPALETTKARAMRKALKSMVWLERFEPPAFGFVVGEKDLGFIT
jgi:hypothetical protein